MSYLEMKEINVLEKKLVNVYAHMELYLWG